LHHVVGQIPSAAFIRSQLEYIKAAESTEKLRRLLDIVVAIAAHHPDRSLYQEVLGYVIATRAHIDAQQFIPLKRAQLTRHANESACNVEVLRPLLHEISNRKASRTPRRAAVHYFARPDWGELTKHQPGSTESSN
jgi:hypothetical protein